MEPITFGEYTIRSLEVSEESLAVLMDLHHQVLPSRAHSTPDQRAKVLREISAGLQGREPLVLAAFTDDGRVVAYKLGYRTGNRRERFYSWLGGVHPAHRRKGLSLEMTRIQHELAAQTGARYVETHTWGHNQAMLIVNLRCGMTVIGTIAGPDRPGVKVILRKELNKS